jgi:uncharacterized repeat protein (TIGR01451 family)
MAVSGLLGLALLSFSTPSSALAATPSAGWSIASLALPTNFSSSDSLGCEVSGVYEEKACDSYTVTVTNSGSQATDGSTVTIVDMLPPGVRFKNISTPRSGKTVEKGYEWQREREFPCAGSELMAGPDAGRWQVTCEYDEPMPAGDALQVGIQVVVTTAEKNVTVQNEAKVEGGGVASPVKTTNPTMASGAAPNTLNGNEPAFGVQNFSFAVDGVDGRPDVQGGDHPYAVTSSFDLTSRFRPPATVEGHEPYEAAHAARDVLVYLPLGFIGDALAIKKRCPQWEVIRETCTKVGEGRLVRNGEEMNGPQGLPGGSLPIYDVVPEKGYPAEFAFPVERHEIMLYASLVRTHAGYAVRVASPGILKSKPGEGFFVTGVSLTFFGNPEAHNGEGTGQAFYANPTSCSNTPEALSARIEAESWDEPGRWSAPLEATVYPAIEGCDLIGAAAFKPSIELEPEEKQADTPSGYEVDLKVPQSENVFANLATPDLRDATVTLPAGVSLSPPAAEGLAGCRETGPEGINVGSNDIGPGGRDEGDPEATELGEGHAGGNGSPYDDGLYHVAPGHCPLKSQIGEVEVKTPLLPEPLKGHVYLAQPQCSGGGQEACRLEDATNGRLYAIYLEVSGAGVIVKLKGNVSVNPSTGQITTTFKENPQLPFEELKLTIDGGQRAPLSNPQTCGTASAASELVPWSTPYTPTATPSSEPPFTVSGCPNPMPFAPGFSAGTVTPSAGGFSPFTVTLTRRDGEQDFGGISVTLPPGVAGTIAKVPLCGEAEANAGTCSEASRIGTATVAAGAGSLPLWLSGRVYLTGPYGGAPFGLSVVVPAKAGPFDLGNEVVRSAISIDPHTAQVTVASEPLRLIRDGIPFRLKTVNVTIDRPEFTFNPTDCEPLRVTGSIAGDMPDGSAGSTVSVSGPFAVTGCKGLPFRPSFAALTHASHSRSNGAYLRVVVKSGAGQANIAKVRVLLPKRLPSRLATLKLACGEQQFAANPAGCPAGSFVGAAAAYTPVLPVPLTGPAIFVSHGGAAFPDLDIVLQGDGVTVILTGNTFINKSGVTESTFASVPDVPVTQFDLVLPAGPHAALSANGNLCSRVMTMTKRASVRVHGRVVRRVRKIRRSVRVKLLMPTTIIGQNGAVVKQSTKLAVSGCPKAKARKAESSARSHTLPATPEMSVETSSKWKASARGMRP